LEKVGQRIKRLRKERKWTQEMLGAKLGVKKAAVQKYESGRVVNLKQETIKKLTDLFEVPPTTFLDCSDWDRYAEKVNLSEQVKTLELIQKYFGDGAVELVHIYSELSGLGQVKLLHDAEKLQTTYGKVKGLN
jgi:transcriptional regulator with XRE-family HTH domain